MASEAVQKILFEASHRYELHRNPTRGEEPRDLRVAVESYREFHWGNEPSELTSVPGDELAHRGVLYELGELTMVQYRTKKGGEEEIEWYHEFAEDGGEPPRLVADSEGQLFIVGGSYTVTEEGIEG